MSRNAVIALSAVLVGVILTGGAGLALLWYWPEYRAQQYLALGNTAYENEEWLVAKRQFAYYLISNDSDFEVMEKYIDACLQLPLNRPKTLGDAGRGMFKLASLNPEDRDLLRTSLVFYEHYGLYNELEYGSAYFLRIFPGDAELIYFRAKALDRLNRGPEARPLYAELVGVKEEPGDEYGRQAYWMRRAGDETGARALIAEGLERFPGHPRMLEQAAEFALEIGELALARAQVDEALSSLPEDPDVLFLASRIAAEHEDFENAMAYARRAIEAAPGNAQGYLSLAFALERLGRLDEAIALLQEMDRYARLDTPQVYLTLSELLLGRNDLDSLAGVIEEYKLAYPDHLLVFEYLEARRMMLLEEYEPALAKMTTVVESNPEFSRAQFYQAVTMLRLERRDQAKVTLERYMRARPDDKSARLLYEMSFGARRTPEELAASAGALLAQSANVSEENLILTARSLLSQVGLASESEEAALAEELLIRAIAQSPDSRLANLSLLDRLLARNEVDRAEAAVESAIERGLPAAALTMQRAAIALMRDDVARALAFYAESRSNPDFTKEEGFRWANYLASQGHYDEGRQILAELAAGEVGDTDEHEIRMAIVGLARQHGGTDRALEEIDSAMAEADLTSEWGEALLEQKLELARALALAEGAENTERSEAVLREVREASPDFPGLQLYEARQLLDQGPAELERARIIAEELLAEEPEKVSILMMLAEASSRLGQYSRALSYANRALENSPDSLGAHLGKADILLSLERFEEVVEICNRVLNENPGNPLALELIVRGYANMRRGAQASNYLIRLESLLDQSQEAQLRLTELRGLVGESLGTPAVSETEAREAYASAPDSYVALQNLVRLLVGQRRVEEARDLVLEYVAGQSENYEAWTLAGQLSLSMQTGDGLEAASTAYTRALFIVPGYPPALRGLIEVQMLNRNYGAAVILCDRYLSVEPDNSHVLYRKAYLLSQVAGRQTEALEAANAAVTLQPSIPHRTLRGYLLLGAERYQEALDDFRWISQTVPVTASGVDAAIAEAYIGLGDLQLGRQYYESATQKHQPGDAAVMQRLERLESLLAEEASAT